MYLVLAAARSPGSDERHAGGLNRIPLDLYLVMVGLGIPCLCAIVLEGTWYFLEENFAVGAALGIGCSYAACLLFVGFLFAVAAQTKTPDGFWWQNLLISRLLRGGFRFIGWLDRQNREYVLPIFTRAGNGLWNVCSKVMVKCYRSVEKFCLGVGELLGGLFRWTGGSVHRFLKLLPLTWQWLIGGAVLLAVTAGGLLAGALLMKLLCLGIGIFLIVYGANCFGTLLETLRKMRKGDLNTKVDDKTMVGAFRDFAGELNALAGVAVVAARKQMGSRSGGKRRGDGSAEELREPLQTLQCYAELLGNAQTETEKAEYLEVIHRELSRMEQLLGQQEPAAAMAVEIVRLDAVEAVAQVLEEYADKLANAHLTPVVRYDGSYASMVADEWMLWRVLSSLLDNAVGHALAGTRVYLNVSQTEDHVLISLRNISREVLDPAADPLAETGSEPGGSGLSVAANLMQLQNGKLQIETDGDLFKAILIFPKE